MSENECRAEMFAAFRELAEIIPEMRAGQLMAAIGELCADLHGRGLWEASDAELLEAVWRFRRDFEASRAEAGALENDPRFVQRTEQARGSLRKGKGIKLEELDSPKRRPSKR